MRRVSILLVAVAFFAGPASAFWGPVGVGSRVAGATQQRAKLASSLSSLGPRGLVALRAAGEGGEGDNATGTEAPAPAEAAAAAADKGEPLMVGPFNLKDGNDWITIFLSGVIAWQSIQIVQEILQGLFQSK